MEDPFDAPEISEANSSPASIEEFEVALRSIRLRVSDSMIDLDMHIDNMFVTRKHLDQLKEYKKRLETRLGYFEQFNDEMIEDCARMDQDHLGEYISIDEIMRIKARVCRVKKTYRDRLSEMTELDQNTYFEIGTTLNKWRSMEMIFTELQHKTRLALCEALSEKNSFYSVLPIGKQKELKHLLSSFEKLSDLEAIKMHVEAIHNALQFRRWEVCQSRKPVLESSPSEDKGDLCVHLRPMFACDVPATFFIDSLSYDGEAIETSTSLNCSEFVAEYKSKIVGFMIYQGSEKALQISKLAVHPEFRRQGIGKQLVSKLINKLSILKRNILSIEVDENNVDAQHFLYAQGFNAKNTTDSGVIDFEYRLRKL